MYCPQCGTETNDQIKFCKRCGTSLQIVQTLLTKGAPSMNPSFDPREWQRMVLEEYREKAAKKNKKSPEQKRLEEIKSGVITTAIGFGSMILLYFLLGAVAINEPASDALVLRNVWLVGLVPFLIGLSILFNGIFISKKIVALKNNEERDFYNLPLFSADPTPVSKLSEGILTPAADFSVTESTTTKLREPEPINKSRDTN